MNYAKQLRDNYFKNKDEIKRTIKILNELMKEIKEAQEAGDWLPTFKYSSSW